MALDRTPGRSNMASDDTNVAPVPKIPNTASKLVPQTKNKVVDMEVPDD